MQRPCAFRDFLETVRALRPGKKLYVVIDDFSSRPRAPSRWTDLFTAAMPDHTPPSLLHALARPRADLKTNCPRLNDPGPCSRITQSRFA